VVSDVSTISQYYVGRSYKFFAMRILVYNCTTASTILPAAYRQARVKARLGFNSKL
jgi:hypothetical protein